MQRRLIEGVGAAAGVAAAMPCWEPNRGCLLPGARLATALLNLLVVEEEEEEACGLLR
jgi:hypothetical protein